MNLIQEQRKKYKKKNWIMNFKKILMRGRNRHMPQKMSKRTEMEMTMRINKQRDLRMRKQNPRRKAMMKKKEVRLRMK
jgi:hypothetical protein